MLLLIFPIVYITSFVLSVQGLFKDKVSAILVFLIFGLSVYTTAFSVTLMNGYGPLIPVLRSFKEAIIICYLGFVMYNFKGKLKLHTVDWLVIAFFFYSLLYVILPIGTYGIGDKLLAFKSMCFFPLVYFTGRFIHAGKINLSEAFHYFCLLSILAFVVLYYEVMTYTHFQTFTGYAEYNYYFFDQEPSGNYGLSWTFEIDNGAKRFASFFSTPLELGAATLITASALVAMATDKFNKLRFSNFALVTLACTGLSIFFSLSRASLVSYFLMIYFYAIIARKKYILWLVHGSIIAAIIYFLFFISKDMEEFVVNSVNFSNPSSLGHLIEWLDGIQAMITHPLGMGLGESGKVSALKGSNTGGENQFIIVGVQAGVIALILYMTIYIKLIAVAFRTVKRQTGRLRKLGIFILLIKIGLIIPFLTSEIEADLYISYVVWFFSGLLINMVTAKETADQQKPAAPQTVMVESGAMG